MAKAKKNIVSIIDKALIGWVGLPIEKAKIQSQFREAVELSAIKQSMSLGILDEMGNPTERVIKLLAEYHEKENPILIGQSKLF